MYSEIERERVCSEEEQNIKKSLLYYDAKGILQSVRGKKKFVEGRSEFISQMIYCNEVVGIRIFHDFFFKK